MTPLACSTGRRAAWCLAVLAFSAALLLAGMSASNYTEIAKASMFTAFSAEAEPSLALDDAGSVESLTLNMTFRLHNPSDKTLRVWLLGFKVWLRDPGMESGTDISRRAMDISLSANGTTYWFLPVAYLSFSYDSPRVLLGPHQDIWLNESMVLDAANHTALQGISGILDGLGGSQELLEWNFYARATLFIEGMPQYAGPEKDSNVVRVSQGVDLALLGVGA